MAAPVSTDEFLDLVRKSGVADERRLTDYLQRARGSGPLAADASRMAGYLVRDGILTQFQAEQILQGKWRRFTIGKYKVLERIGSGGMGAVYLCEHKHMRRRVAVKVLPTAKASDESALERFYREARAVAALDHPNIVHAYDIDEDNSLHFLVMEYVDGSSLQDIIKKAGPLDIERACHYIAQSAAGLEHASQNGLVHRDIKPGNILVDRQGTVKILDMGLARFFNDEEDNLTQRFDENVLGTADYLAPEQAVDSHGVDIRADIYSLGATFYYILTGRTPFGEGTVAQKLLWHQSRQPRPVTEYRKDVPAELSAVISKMMAKEPDLRYQRAAEVAEALTPYTQGSIGPPPESEMPRLSLAAQGIVPSDSEMGATPRSDQPAPRALQGMGPGSKPPSGPGNRPAAETVAASPNTPRSPAPKPRATPPSDAPAHAKMPSATPISRPTSPAPAARAPAPPPTPRPAPASKPKREPAPPPAAAATAAESASDNALAFFETISNESENTPGDVESPSDVDAVTPPRSSPSNRRLALAGQENRVRKMSLWFGAAFAVLALVITVGWFAVLRPMLRPPPPTVRLPLEVSADTTRPNSFRTLGAALLKSQRGDVIHLLDAVHEENLRIDFTSNTLSSDVTVQAAPGQEVLWVSKAKNIPDQALLFVKGAGHFKIKDVTFDGSIDSKKRAQYLIEIQLRSPGLTFENVRLQSFDTAAIKFMNGFGEAGRPIRFKNLVARTASGENPRAAILFDANPAFNPPTNDWIEFLDAQFIGIKVPFGAVRKDVVGENVIGISNVALLPEIKPEPKKTGVKVPDTKKPEAKKTEPKK